jgi:hypothetical protein
MSNATERVEIRYGTQAVYPNEVTKGPFLSRLELEALADAIGARSYPYAAPAEYRERSALPASAGTHGPARRWIRMRRCGDLLSSAGNMHGSV